MGKKILGVFVKLQFLGATGTVTGSKYLVTAGKSRVLIDCGLFQGFKNLRLRNWAKLPFKASDLTAVVLTHAHLDHSGYLPLLVKQGFTGPVYCTEGTADLLNILLPDSGHLQEEEARFANKHSFSKHKPALPLYTLEDAYNSLKLIKPVGFGQNIKLSDDFVATCSPTGHIIGASAVHLKTVDSSILFSGDVGRYEDPVMKPPAMPPSADYLVIESTYGSRLHKAEDPKIQLAAIINETFKKGGVLVIPAFAVGRTQTLLYYLDQLLKAGLIPKIPIFLDSPMAAGATAAFLRHCDELQIEPRISKDLCSLPKYVTSPEDSIKLDERIFPKIIISASGMATGGRVLHHIKAFVPDSKNTVLFTGYQSPGTRGALMAGGKETIRIHGEEVRVNATVKIIETLSAHGDYSDILRWIRSFSMKPKKVFVTHGDPESADALRWRLEHELLLDAYVPFHLEDVSI
jgi:metallo-beta-lactamase family protein